MKEAREPRAGDISICGACGKFGIYLPSLDIVEPPAEIMRIIENTPEIMAMRDALIHRDGM